MSFDRVTKSGTRQSMLGYLDVTSRRLAQRQQDIASGRRLHQASDSPPDAAVVMEHRRQLDRMAQFTRNADSARGWVDTSDSVLVGVSDVLTRSRTLTLQAVNASQNPQSRAALAAEVDAIADQMLSLANTTSNGRPLFAGTSGGQIAFAADGTYVGAETSVTRGVNPGTIFEVGRPGTLTFGTHDALDPMNGNAFQVLRATADAIRAGDTTEMSRAVGSIDTAHDRVLSEVGRLGSLGVRLEAMQEQRDLQALDTGRQLSQLQDVDMAEAILKLRSAESSYEATLAATSKLLSSSLLDFLR